MIRLLLTLHKQKINIHFSNFNFQNLSYNEIFKKYNIVPKKSLGQNFLVNDSILEKIASYTDLSNKNIVEVWSWYWALTEKILLHNPNVLELIELDKKMIDILELRMNNEEWIINNCKNKIIINNIDILKYYPKYKNYSVVANIPYYITSPILTHFFYKTEYQPIEMIILMQRDVADKIRKNSWNKNSVLSLWVDFACEEVKEIVRVPNTDFIPSPKIESSVLYFKLRKQINKEEAKVFLKIIKSWFAEKRKKLISNLSKIGWFNKEKLNEIFTKLNLSDNARAEELSLETWKIIVKELS